MTIRITENLEFLPISRPTARNGKGAIWFDQGTNRFKIREIDGYGDGYTRYINNTGNLNLLQYLVNMFGVFNLYVATYGSDDVDGYGFSVGKPFRTIQRAFDEIPDGANGTVLINLVGSGPFDEAIPRDYKSPNFLYVMVIGDRTTAGPSGVLTQAATQPTNPTGGHKYAVLDFNIGAYVASFTNGSHWCTFETTDTSQYGLAAVYPTLMDCINNSSPNIRALPGFDWFNALGTAPVTVRTYPFVSVVENQRLTSDKGASEHLTWLKAPYSHSQRIIWSGCILGRKTGLVTTNASLWACLCPSGIYDDSQRIDLAIHVNAEGQQFPPEAIIAGGYNRGSYVTLSSGGGFSGIFDGGVIDYWGASGFISNCIFRNIGSGGYQLVAGAHTDPAPGGSFKMDSCDFEPPSSQAGILARRVNFRHGSFGGSSLNSHVSTWLTLDQHSWAEIELPIDGYTQGTSVTVGDHSFIEGLGSFSAGAPLMRNITTPGSDVQIGSMSPISWATLVANPQTDLAKMARAE